MKPSDVQAPWLLAIAQLKQRVFTAQRRSPGNHFSALLDEAIRICESLVSALEARHRECDALVRQYAELVESRDQLFQEMPVSCVETTSDGRILAVNRAAARLLNTSGRHLLGRLLTHFMEERTAFMELLSALSDEAPSLGPTPLRLRPRERAPLTIDARAVADSAADGTAWWFLVPRDRQAVCESDPAAAPLPARAERESFSDVT